MFLIAHGLEQTIQALLPSVSPHRLHEFVLFVKQEVLIALVWAKEQIAKVLIRVAKNMRLEFDMQLDDLVV